MWKFKIGLIICLLTFGLFSVKADKPKIGLRAGFGLAKLQDAFYSNYVPGLSFGFIGEKMLLNDYGVQAGLCLSTLGFTDNTLVARRVYRTLYVQLPVQVIYKYKLNRDFSLCPIIGYYFAYGLYGTDEHFDRARKFDFGAIMGINLQINKGEIGLNYHRGLVNVYPRQELKNGNFMMTFGFFF